MALEFARGTIQWLAADAATTLYTISGLAFQPSVIRCYCVGISSTVNATSTTAHSRRSTGFATSTTSRRCIATQDQDATAAATCTSSVFNDCILATVTSTPARDGALDLDSIQSAGFKLIVDDATPVDITVFWEAWGGSDIIAAGVGDIAEPAATGNQDYATGGVAANVVFLAGVQSTAAVNTVQRNDSGFMMGFTAGASDNFVIVGNNDDASATMDADRYSSDANCLAMIPTGGGTADATAVCTQLVAATGMRLNWLTRGTTNRRYIYCWVQGGSWRVLSTNVTMSPVNTTTTVSGLTFTPKGLLGVAWGGGAGNGNSFIDFTTFGSATSTSDRATLSSASNDGSANAEINLAVEYDEFLTEIGNDGTGVFWRIDIDAMLSDGFRFIVDKTNIATQRIGVVTFGSTPVAATAPMRLPLLGVM